MLITFSRSLEVVHETQSLPSRKKGEASIHALGSGFQPSKHHHLLPMKHPTPFGIATLMVTLFFALGEVLGSEAPEWAREIQQEKPVVLEFAYGEVEKAPGAPFLLLSQTRFLKKAKRVRLNIAPIEGGVVEREDGCLLVFGGAVLDRGLKDFRICLERVLNGARLCRRPAAAGYLGSSQDRRHST
jgi:hypothetical protein